MSQRILYTPVSVMAHRYGGLPVPLNIDATEFNTQGVRNAILQLNIEFIATSLFAEARRQEGLRTLLEKSTISFRQSDTTNNPVTQGHVLQWLRHGQQAMLEDAEAILTKIQEELPAIDEEQKKALSARTQSVTLRIQSSISKLPDYIRGAFAQENADIIVKPTMSRHTILGASAPRVGHISLREDVVNAADHIAINTLQEEILHHLDLRLDFRNNPAFLASAQKILQNATKIDAIDREYNTIQRSKNFPVCKKPVTAYPAEEQPAELLVNYFEIKEFYRQLADHSGCSIPFITQKPKVDQMHIRTTMEKIFGGELCEACDGSEQQLIEIASKQQITPQRS